jgi:hypothetical protein
MSADTEEPGSPDITSEWRCRLCGHWVLVPAGSQPFAMLSQIAGKPRECVVHADGRAVHRCQV